MTLSKSTDFEYVNSEFYGALFIDSRALKVIGDWIEVRTVQGVHFMHGMSIYLTYQR